MASAIGPGLKLLMHRKSVDRNQQHCPMDVIDAGAMNSEAAVAAGIFLGE